MNTDDGDMPIDSGDLGIPAGDDLDALADRLIESDEPDDIDESEGVEMSETDEVEDDEDAGEEDIEEGDEDEESDPSAELYDVKVDGQIEKVTLDELRRGYSGQKYITQQMQKAAEDRKVTEAVFTQLARERQAVGQALQLLGSGQVMPPPQPPDESLFNTDPIAYMDQKIEYDRRTAQFNEQLAAVQQQMQAGSQAMAQAQQAYLARELEVLKGFEPDLYDPEKGREARHNLAKSAIETYGFDINEVGTITDHRHIRVLRDAIRYQELVANGGAKRVEQKRASQTVKPKARRKGGKQSLKDQHARLKKTGNLEDAIGLLLQ